MKDILITILVAFIPGLLSLIGVIYSVKKSNAELLMKIQHQSELADVNLKAELEKHQAVTDTKIDELTREVRKHNNFAERIPALETKVEALEKAAAH